MNSWMKLGFAAFVAPGLTTVVLLVVGALTGLFIGVGAILMLAFAAGLLTLGVLNGVHRSLRNRFSPVRRKQPRPTAWNQWR